MTKKCCAFALLTLVSGAVSAGPFPTRDQNPLLLGFGLPMPLPASIRQAPAWSFSLDLNWSNTALVQAEGDEELIVDAETRETRLTIGRALTDRFGLQVQIPYRNVGAGSLDSFIDDWHDAFGLPEGARPQLPEDEMHVGYERAGAVMFDTSSPYDGLGDISLDLGYELHSSPAASLSVWLSLELPTGSDSAFTTNDALDASVVLASERRFDERWSLFGQGAVSMLGEGDLLADQQHDLVWSGLAGIGWRPFAPVEFKVQIDARTAVFDDSALDFLNEAVVLTVGGAIHWRSGWRLDLGVSEDILVESAADVVFVIGVSKEARSD